MQKCSGKGCYGGKRNTKHRKKGNGHMVFPLHLTKVWESIKARTKTKISAFDTVEITSGDKKFVLSICCTSGLNVKNTIVGIYSSTKYSMI